MPAPRIRGDYDSLAQISQAFARRAADTKRTIQRVKRQINTLQGGDWIGKGATAFYREMDSELLPSLKRLATALSTANRVARQTSQILKQAEEEAARILKGGVANGQFIEQDGVSLKGGPREDTRAARREAHDLNRLLNEAATPDQILEEARDLQERLDNNPQYGPRQRAEIAETLIELYERYDNALSDELVADLEDGETFVIQMGPEGPLYGTPENVDPFNNRY